MKQTLGQLIGILTDNFSITSDDKTAIKLAMRLKYDFTMASDDQIKQWLCADRRIAFSRPNRSLSRDELVALNDTVIQAGSAGCKTKSRNEHIEMIMNTLGCSRAQAEYALDNVDMLPGNADDTDTDDTDDETTTE